MCRIATKLSHKNFAPQLFFLPPPPMCVFAFALHTHTFHSQAVNGAPSWCDDCAGQCAPLCDCMPPRLRLSLDTSQPSRPADLYPTVTLSERHRETEEVGERREERGRETEKSEGKDVGSGGHEERLQKVKGCDEVIE